jgi:hypothetical protein
MVPRGLSQLVSWVLVALSVRSAGAHVQFARVGRGRGRAWTAAIAGVSE